VARLIVMAAKLKVYATRIGFHDAVVAAPNQTAALAAWDIHDNLFAHGSAAITDDAAAIKAATAKPGVVLRRAAGSDEAFSEAPSAPKVKAPPKAKAAKPAKPPPDRRPLDAAEKALADLADEEKRASEDFARRRTALEQDRDRARRDFERAERR
jgi:hypothetical protein